MASKKKKKLHTVKKILSFFLSFMMFKFCHQSINIRQASPLLTILQVLEAFFSQQFDKRGRLFIDIFFVEKSTNKKTLKNISLLLKMFSHAFSFISHHSDFRCFCVFLNVMENLVWKNFNLYFRKFAGKLVKDDIHQRLRYGSKSLFSKTYTLQKRKQGNYPLWAQHTLNSIENITILKKRKLR